MRLRTRFVVAFLVAALVLSVTTLVGFTLYRDAIVDGEHDDLSRTSESVASQLDTGLNEKQNIVNLWAQQSDLVRHGSPAQNVALGTFIGTTTFSGASVVAPNGTMTAIQAEGLTNSEEAALVGGSFGERTYVQRALSGETHISDPVLAESGYYVVTVSTPLYDGGTVVGSFNAAFHLDQGDLATVFQSGVTETQGIHVIADGVTVHGAGPNPTANEDVLVANATVGETGWTVSATRSRSAFESRLWTVTRLQGGAFLLVLVSMAVFGAWLYREYIGNFERLHGGFASLVAGDYGARVTLSGAAEWEHVETQFNELSETLAQRRTEVIVLNRVLRHNLRNAMTVVVGNADRIAERTDDRVTADEADRIKRRGEALLDLADHARAVESSIGNPADETGVRPVGDLLDEVVTAIDAEFPTAEIELRTDVGDSLVHGGDLLVVAFDELVRNAIVHGGIEDCRVTLDATDDDESVTITVIDEGPGLPAVEQRVLTEPFIETPTEHGTGLGLWLVNWLITWAGGDVDVTVDDGTTVTVAVPRASPDD